MCLVFIIVAGLIRHVIGHKWLGLLRSLLSKRRLLIEIATRLPGEGVDHRLLRTGELLVQMRLIALLVNLWLRGERLLLGLNLVKLGA